MLNQISFKEKTYSIHSDKILDLIRVEIHINAFHTVTLGYTTRDVALNDELLKDFIYKAEIRIAHHLIN